MKTTKRLVRIAVLVDYENDFCEGGSLAVMGGASAAERAAAFLFANPDLFDYVVTTRDWHVDPGTHFASATGEAPNFTTTWPDHCPAGEFGSEYHPNIKPAVVTFAVAEFLKGQHDAAYSGFEATSMTDSRETLGTWMLRTEERDNVEISEIVVFGIATDYCDKATVLDATRFVRVNNKDTTVTLLSDLCAAVNPETEVTAIAEMRAAGAIVTTSDQYLAEAA